ncbi:MAG: NUDIX hydrolase, partial [Actinomycetota bacterium]
MNPLGRSDAALEAALAGAPAPGAAVGLDRDPTPAAVLVPLVEHGSGMTVLLTQRTAHLANHPGQISFPGGRLEDCDCGDLVVCALRETEEEIGLTRGRVEVLGRLDDYITGTGFVVTPVVGLVRPPFDTYPDPFEVAEI